MTEKTSLGQGIRQWHNRYQVRWLDAQGVRRAKSFASLKEARDYVKSGVQRDQPDSGGKSDPDDSKLAVASAPPKTFGELCDEWLTTRAVMKRSRATDESFIKVHLRPRWGAQPLREIVWSREVEHFKVARHDLSNKTVNNILTLLVSMLRQGVEIGWLQVAPRVRKHKLEENEFTYLRTDDEVRRFLSAAKEEGIITHALYATAVYSGMRLGELAGLKWSAIDFENRLIRVSVSYDGPTKGREVRSIPILDPLLPILRAWRLIVGAEPLVFTNQAGKMLRKDSRVFDFVLHRVLKEAGLPERYIRFHDLRHTFASHWMMRGGDVFKLQKILGHKSIEMTMRYSHLAPSAFSADYGRLSALDPFDVSEVIPIRSGA
ncbi:MAG: site-specific integrase [Deltaproteobacteria bacterium]|nr:site-specific integrase [Deltaproteobacteria bacterium]